MKKNTLEKREKKITTCTNKIELQTGSPMIFFT